MKETFSFLLILVFLILCSVLILLVSLLFHKNTATGFPLRKKHGKHVAMEDGERERLSEDYTIRWKDSDLFFETFRYEEAICLSWRGAVWKKDRILYVFTQKDAFEAFMSACQNIFDRNELPAYEFDVFYDENGLMEHVSDLILLHMTRMERNYVGVIQDDSGFRHLSGVNEISALIGIGYSGSACFSFSGDNSDYDWISGISSKTFEPVRDDWFADLADRLKRIFDLHADPFFYRKRVRRIMEMIPESTGWFLPSVSKEEGRIVLFSENMKQLSECSETLKKSAARASVRIKKETECAPCSFQIIDHSFYDLCCNAIHKSYRTEIIPVYMNVEEKQQLHLGCNVIHFAPLLNGSRFHAISSVDFYECLLKERNQD